MKFNIGGLGEFSDWELIEYSVSDKYSTPCPHCTQISENEYLCSRVILQLTQGGFDATVICLDCILDAVVTE